MRPGTTETIGSEIRPMLALAVPIVVVQVGMMAMGVADTLMVGRISAVGLAAVALGNIYVFGVLVFGMGALMALDPIVAQAVGAHDRESVARGIQRGGCSSPRSSPFPSPSCSFPAGRC